MKFYCAPLEGITGYIYRNAHHALFPGVDKYFSPFIVANQSEKLKSKEQKDILPENNKDLPLVPQLLSNQSREFIRVSKIIKEYGYKEVNLNLGCPSKTVVSKFRGSGFLAKREELDQFLDEVCSASITKISVKTRLGLEEPEEFYELIEIFNKYPLEELIIHPRVQKDYYKNKPNWDIFKEAMILSKNPVCYNGDIFSVEDYKQWRAVFPNVNSVMFGRGLIGNPGLIGNIINGEQKKRDLLKEFHDCVYKEYQRVLSGERDVLFRMKEMWNYMITFFKESEKYGKKIKKVQKLSDYNCIISSLFLELELY